MEVKEQKNGQEKRSEEKMKILQDRKVLEREERI